MKRFTPILIALLFLTGTTNAEIEKRATNTDTGIQLTWWPKVTPPHGWHFDKGSSYHFAFNALAPNGATFHGAKTVMYAEATYKPRVPEMKNIESFITQDIANFKEGDLCATATREDPVTSGEDKQFYVVSFVPSAHGNWERVAYGEEGEFYIVFTVSSRTKTGLANAMPAFDQMLHGYRVGP